MTFSSRRSAAKTGKVHKVPVKGRAAQMAFALAWVRTSPMFQPLQVSIHTELMERWAERIDELRAKRGKLDDSQYLHDLVEIELNYITEFAEQFFLKCCEKWRGAREPESLNFFRALWGRCLEPLLEVRKRYVLQQLKRKALDCDEKTRFKPSDIEDANARFGKLYTILKAKLRIMVLGGDYHSIERRQVTMLDAPAVQNPQGQLSRKRYAKKRPRDVEARELTIFNIISMGFKGLKYCHAVDKKVTIPDAWRKEGCPKTYVEAYKVVTDRNWRKRIQDEKYRIRKRYEPRTVT